MEIIYYVTTFLFGLAIGMYIVTKINGRIQQNLEEELMELKLNIEDWKWSIEELYKNRYKCKCNNDEDEEEQAEKADEEDEGEEDNREGVYYD